MEQDGEVTPSQQWEEATSRGWRSNGRAGHVTRTQQLGPSVQGWHRGMYLTRAETTAREAVLWDLGPWKRLTPAQEATKAE